jgi:hypothetical protein
MLVSGCGINVNISLRNGDKPTGVAAGIVGQYAWASLQLYIYNCDVRGSLNASSVAILNGASPWSTCTVEYKNNTCDMYLKGTRTTLIEDYYFFDD